MLFYLDLSAIVDMQLLRRDDIMTERVFYQEDSPCVEMKGMSWPTLTEGQVCKRFSKGHILYNQQEFCEDVYIIQRGRVAMCLCTPNGGMRIAVILNEGCMFGHQTLCHGTC